MQVKSFEEGKYYVMTGSGKSWADFDGPFDNPQKAKDHLLEFLSDYTTPEMMQMVITYFKDGTLDLYKENGVIINLGSLACR